METVTTETAQPMRVQQEDTTRKVVLAYPFTAASGDITAKVCVVEAVKWKKIERGEPTSKATGSPKMHITESIT